MGRKGFELDIGVLLNFLAFHFIIKLSIFKIMYGKITLSSVLDSELLASALNQNLQRQTLSQMPGELRDPEFQAFIDEVQPMVHTNMGYMFIGLD
jgi:hypothetical protein